MARQLNREKQADDFFKHLADKYGGGTSSSKSASSSSSAKKTTGSRKRKESRDGRKTWLINDWILTVVEQLRVLNILIMYVFKLVGLLLMVFFGEM